MKEFKKRRYGPPRI